MFKIVSDNKTKTELALQAIADGYPYRVQTPGGNFINGFIAVDNPKFREDDGSDPFIVIEYVEG